MMVCIMGIINLLDWVVAEDGRWKMPRGRRQNVEVSSSSTL